MAQFEEKLAAIAEQLKNGVVPPKESVRAFLLWFGAERRGYRVIRRVRSHYKVIFLTHVSLKSSLHAMRNRPFVAGLSINAFLRVANVATRQAAIDTVKSGHSVFGLEKGQIVEYGPGHQSLPGIEEEVGSARQK